MFIALQQSVARSSSTSTGDGVPALFIVLYWAYVLILQASYWGIFSKAGEPGWTSLIPIYGTVKLFQIAGSSGWWTLALLLPLVNIFVLVRLMFDMARVFGR